MCVNKLVRFGCSCVKMWQRAIQVTQG